MCGQWQRCESGVVIVNCDGMVDGRGGTYMLGNDDCMKKEHAELKGEEQAELEREHELLNCVGEVEEVAEEGNGKVEVEERKEKAMSGSCRRTAARRDRQKKRQYVRLKEIGADYFNMCCTCFTSICKF